MKMRMLGAVAAGALLALAGCNGQNGQRANSQGGANARPAGDLPASDTTQAAPVDQPTNRPAAPVVTPSERPGAGFSGDMNSNNPQGDGMASPSGSSNVEAGTGMSGAEDGGMMEMDGGMMSTDAGAPDAGHAKHGKKAFKKKK